MRKGLIRATGRCLFWLGWPLWRVYLPRTQRVRLALIHEERLLVVLGWLSAGKWELPGGGMLNGETPKQAAQRELREEVGLEWDGQTKEIYKGWMGDHGLSWRAVILTSHYHGNPTMKLRQNEILQARWVTPEELATMPVATDVKQFARTWSKS